MKTKRHFIYHETDTKYSRTYGGRDYRLVIMEVIKKGEIKYHGRTETRCSRGHMGEESEAWSWVFHNVLTPRERKAWLKQTGNTNPKPWSVYFDYRVAEALGFKLERIGPLG